MYLCKTLIQNTCIEWVEHKPTSLSDELSAFANMSFGDISAIWTQVLLLFATAYVFKHLPFFIRRR